MRRVDAATAAAVLAFAAVAVHEAGQLPFGTVRNPGPGFVPWWVGATLGLLAVLMLAQALVAGPSAGRAEPGARLWRVGGLLLGLSAYVLLLEPLGYPVCTFLLVLFMLRVVDPHRWATALGVATIAALGSFVVFATWLKVPLPPGSLLR